MGKFLWMVVIMMNSSGFASDSSRATSQLQQFLTRPLIVGASVSGDYLAPSPGRVLALRHTTTDQIQTWARNGKPGVEVLAQLPTDRLNNRSGVIAMDLFFWDSFRADPGPTLSALNRFLLTLRKAEIPIVIGEIPGLMPSLQPSRELLNRRLREACHEYRKCRILPLQSILEQTFERGYVTHNGRRYEISELLPDGLHLSKPASEHLADQIADVIATIR